MARIRSVHPGLFTDEAFVSCSPMARLMAIGLWTEADDQGVFEWKPLTLKMRILPGDASDVPELLTELADNGLVCRFEAGGKAYGAVRNFRKFQRPKKPVEVYPLPDSMHSYVGLDLDREANARKKKWEEQDGKCFYCNTGISHYSKRHDSLEIDHRVPRIAGGTDDDENLVAACRSCNRAKGAKSEDEFRAWLSENSVSGASRKVSHSESGPKKTDGGWRREDGEKNPPTPLAGGRGERLPADWTLPDDWLAWSVAEGMGKAAAKAEADKFRDYWLGVSGAKGRKLDWQATWRNWCRNARDRQKPRDGTLSVNGLAIPDLS